MAKLQFKQEWRLWAGVAAVFVALVVYLYLASRPPMEGGKYLWFVAKVSGPTELTLRGTGKVVTFKLIGLKVPQSQADAARDFLEKTLKDQWVATKVLSQGEKGEEMGFAYLSGDDINARMIRLGLAELDRTVQGFDVRPYIELEQEAKRQQRGLWAESGKGAQ